MTVLWVGKTSGLLDVVAPRDCTLVPSGKQAVEADLDPDLVVLDAIALRTPGARICKALRSAYPQTPLLHLHPGPAPKSTPADELLVGPVTADNLRAAIDRLLNVAQGRLIVAGPFCVDVARRVLIVDGRETQLTPKVADLLTMFLKHPNETLPRERVMAQVWETDYMGDTRTLDVHIRWIREAFEDTSRSPRYLKTVRGVGYKLEV